MGSRQMLEDEELKDEVAQIILIEAEAISMCKCGCDYINASDADAFQYALELGNSMIEKKDELVDVFDGDKKALSDRITSVYLDTDLECQYEQAMKE